MGDWQIRGDTGGTLHLHMNQKFMVLASCP
jgi:hypothetical protein